MHRASLMANRSRIARQRLAIPMRKHVIVMPMLGKGGRMSDTSRVSVLGNIEIIGSPEQVVERLAALHCIGIDGVKLSFYDFEADIEYFGSKILPLLKEAELRV
jgi:alkanesulfonate monooxygenase SsuD/methylene tetrahydromethanopterin reductase-like flavin-dependent oxidoreductase (luciferase family)